MKKIKVKFFCHEIEETVDIEIYPGDNEESVIEAEFNKWLDNNQQCGYEKL